MALLFSSFNTEKNTHIMKELLLTTLFTLIVGTSITAQTYCYKLLSYVDKETGVKSKASEAYYYITFQSNKSSCYFSDKNGNSTINSSGYASNFTNSNKYEGKNYYVYKGVDNGRYVYEETVIEYQYVYPNITMGEWGGYYPYIKKKKYLYFSQNFERLNEWQDPEVYYIESTNQTVKAAQTGYAIGTGIVKRNNGGTIKTTIYVYEKSSEPVDKKISNPTMMY